MARYTLGIEKEVHEIVKSESKKRNKSIKDLVQDAIIEYFKRHSIIKSESLPREIKLGELYDFFDEYIKEHAYFNIRNLSIEFLMDIGSFTYKDASKSEGLGKIKYRFSRIIGVAIQQKILMKHNRQTIKVIQKPF